MGGRLQLHFLAPSQSAKKAPAKQGLLSAEPRLNLSHTSHTRHMDTDKPKAIVLFIIGILMLVGWVLVIWVACEVTTAALHTLQYIVDLAQMDP